MIGAGDPMRGPAFVLMAWEGPRRHAECWHPIAVLDHEPSPMEAGRLLFAAHRAGGLPWGHPRGDSEWGPRPLKVEDVTSVVELRLVVAS